MLSQCGNAGVDDIDAVDMFRNTVEGEPLCDTILHPCQRIQGQRCGGGWDEIR